MNRLLILSLLLACSSALSPMRAEPARLVIAAPGYPQDDMPDREKVMATLASYLLWPAAQRPVAPSHLCYEYEKYCKARWALTEWNVRKSEHADAFTGLHKAMHEWSNQVAAVASSKNGAITGVIYREYWANEMKLEDAIAEGSARLPDKDTLPDTTPRAFLETIELRVSAIPPYVRGANAREEDDPVSIRDFPEDKAKLIKATQRLNTWLSKLPLSVTYPVIEEVRRTIDSVYYQ